MLVTLEWMKENYVKYNDMLFGGELPNINFKIGRGVKTWGFASYRFNLNNGTITPTCITVSNHYDSPEEVKINTLIHEMIHIYDYATNPQHFLIKTYDYWRGTYVYKKRSRKSYDAHGDWFKAQCERVNKFGFKVSTNVQRWEQEASKLSDKAQAALDKKKAKGAIIGFINVKNGKAPWFKIKTDEKGMEEYIRKVTSHMDFYKKYNNYVEWYRTFDENNCKLRSTIKRGWYLSDLDKEFQVKVNVMQFIKKTAIDEPPQEKANEPKKVFQIKTNNGIFKCDASNTEELFKKVKERFPNMNDETVNKIINNPSNFIMESKRYKEIIREVIDEYIAKEEERYDSSQIEGQRRFIKDLGNGEYIESIE